jgi:hypothetical protein
MWRWPKRFRRSLFVIVPILIVTGCWMMFPWREKWGNKASFNKIETGMSRKEVEAILGRPPGSYTTKPYLGGERPPGRTELGRMGSAVLLPLSSIGGRYDFAKHRLDVWNFDDGTAQVECYDEKVLSKRWHSREESPLQIVRDILKRVGL